MRGADLATQDVLWCKWLATACHHERTEQASPDPPPSVPVGLDSHLTPDALRCRQRLPGVHMRAPAPLRTGAASAGCVAPRRLREFMARVVVQGWRLGVSGTQHGKLGALRAIPLSWQSRPCAALPGMHSPTPNTGMCTISAQARGGRACDRGVCKPVCAFLWRGLQALISGARMHAYTRVCKHAFVHGCTHPAAATHTQPPMAGYHTIYDARHG